MNCREFENLLLPLVRSEKLESDARETALSHAKTCSRCAARLLDERSLMAGLRTLAMNSRSETAPVHLELRLRKVFHERQAGRARVAGNQRFVFRTCAAVRQATRVQGEI